MSFRDFGISAFALASVFALGAAMAPHRFAISEFTTLVRHQAELGLGISSGDDPAVSRPSGASVALPLVPEKNPGADDIGPFRRLDLAPPGPNDVRTYAHDVLPPRAAIALAPRPVAQIAMPWLIAPDLPLESGSDTVLGDDRELTRAQRLAVTARLKENLTKALLRNFSLFLYVSTAPSGPLAQRLYVFEKNAKGELVLTHDWAASTGREQYEVSPTGRHTLTHTPGGYYELDPDRMYVRYHSVGWDQPMPYAMFFNWENKGIETGLAIHAADGGDIARLGRRASAGCVHLSPEHARALYNLIRADYRGEVPRFAYDRDTQTMSNTGELMRGRDGKLKMTDGYQVLIFIENFGGRNRVAALD